MSNYKKDDWSTKWNILYKKFCKKHKTKLLKILNIFFILLKIINF